MNVMSRDKSDWIIKKTDN